MIEQLSDEQFGQLAYIADGFVPCAKQGVALVSRDGNGEIDGRIFLLFPAHLEGPWIKPERRNTLLCSQLVEAAEETAKNAGLTRLFAYAISPEIEGYLKRLGYEQMPMTVWMKDI